MKKAGLLAMLLAGALVLGMGVGCGEKQNQGGTEQGGIEQGGTEQGGTQQGGTEQGGTEQGGTEQGGNEQGGVEIGKDTDVSAIVSDKLTEAEWKEALSEEILDNFLMYGKRIDSSNTIHEMFLSVCDNNMHQKLTDGDYADEMIFIEKEETTEFYMRTTGPGKAGKWSRYELPTAGANHHLAILKAFRNHFQDSEYREDFGGYVCTGEKLEIEKGSANDVFLLKFKGGKPCVFGDVSGNIGPVAVIYGFGEAEEIVPPENYEEAG